MKKIKNVNLGRFRFLFQLIAFVFLVYGGFIGFDLGDKLPTFSCVFNSEGRGGVCYLGILQHELNHPWETFLGFVWVMFLISLGMFILWFLVFNKAWCGYMCPLGTMQDWITKLRERLKIGYSEYSWANRKKIKSIKYILLILLIVLPFGISNSLLACPNCLRGFRCLFAKSTPPE